MLPYDYINKCNEDPILPLDIQKSVNARDLILAHTAVKHPEAKTIVIDAIDRLILIKHPLINKILEIIAFSMHFNKVQPLYMFITDFKDFAEMQKRRGCEGFYNKLDNLIVIAKKNDDSQYLAGVILHEMVHTVSYFANYYRDEKCKSQAYKQFFHKTFRSECDISTEIKQRKEQYRTEMHQTLQNTRSLYRAENYIDLVRAITDYFKRQMRRVEERYRVALEIYQLITAGYESSEFQSEFVSFYLQQFISSLDYTLNARFPTELELRAVFKFDDMTHTMPKLSKDYLQKFFEFPATQFWKNVVYQIFKSEGILFLQKSRHTLGCIDNSTIYNTPREQRQYLR